MKKGTSIVVGILCLAGTFAAAQDQITLNPQTDTWIKKNDTVDRSADQQLSTAGKIDSGIQPQESALLRFDLGALHKHDWVDHAEVTLHVQSSTWIDVYDQAGVGLFAVNKPWASNANWMQYNSDYSLYWSQSGCEGGDDRDSTPDATVQFHNYSTAGDYTWLDSDLTATVQDWQRGARANRGWLVRLYGGIYQSGKTDRVQFCSNEGSIPENRPELFLTYHRESLDWKDDTGSGGVWDTTTQNWSWIGGETKYVDGADPDEVLFSKNTGGVISVAGTVSPKSTTIGEGYWTFRDGAIGGNGNIEVGGSVGYAYNSIAEFEAANTFAGRVYVFEYGRVNVAADGALGLPGGGKETWVYEGGMLAFTNGVDYTTDESVYCRGHGQDGQGFGALGAFGNANNRFAGTVHILDDTTVYVETGSSLELTDSIYMGSDYELTVKGGGTLELSGDQTFNGRYVVAADTTLRVNNAVGSATGSGSVTLQTDSVLGGSGTLQGAVSVGNDATVAPGNSIGTLTVGSLELNDSSLLAFELGQPGIAGGTANDLIVVNGDLILDGVLHVTPEALFGEGTYTLILYDTGASFTNNGLQFGDMPDGYFYDISTATPGNVELIVTPEPATVCLLILGGWLLGWRKRRRDGSPG